MFTRAVADPDSLADVPVIQAMAADKGWVGFESLSYLIRGAYERVVGEVGSLDEAVEAALRDLPRPDEPAGEPWDGEDDDANRRHLPRLSALFL